MRRLPLLLAMLVMLSACGDDDGGGLLTGEDGPTSTSAVGPGLGDGGEVDPDAVLALLRDECEAGDYVMCDLLYQASPFDSELEAFGDSCGDRNEPAGFCAEIYGEAVDLDALVDPCREGDMVACDQLYIYSDLDSLEESVGANCGGRGRDALACVLVHGLRAG